jgi:hypothetical protein
LLASGKVYDTQSKVVRIESLPSNVDFVEENLPSLRAAANAPRIL